MEVTGRIKLVNPEQQVSATFKKRELVVTTEEQYPQTLMIEFVQDKADLLSAYKPGENVKVSVNLTGREWVSPQGETKYFTSLRGWRIERMQAEMPTQQQAAPAMPAAPSFEPAANFTEEEHDDLPF